MKILFLLFLLPVLIYAQKSVDITGRASLNNLFFDYDERSDIIDPNSVSSKEYGKTSLIPGFQQLLNLAVFARTQNFDISLLSDLQYNKWDKLDFTDHWAFERFSLNMRYHDHEFIVGDFFEAGSEFFMQSREIRGVKVDLKYSNIWNSRSFIYFKSLYGISQKQLKQGARIPAIYKQYETSGQFKRNLVSATAQIGQTGMFRTGIKYLYAKDSENSIPQSLNDPLANQIIGADAALFLWDSRIQLFGEGYTSKKDTIDFQSATDHSYKGGIDFRYDQFKLIAFYQRLGFNYYTAGYPFLLNDKQGFRVQSVYNIPDYIYFSGDFEQYENNLDEDPLKPVTNTRIAEFSATTIFKNLPEFTILLGYRDDLSKSVFSGENLDEETKTDKISLKYEFRVSYNYRQHRFSLSSIFLDLDDQSKIVGGAPLGTKQQINTFNFYTRPANSFFISGGVVYSRLLLSDGKDNRNLFMYQSNRWDIIPQKLFVESNLNYSFNDAQNGGNEDLLNDYSQIDGQLSVEYFFNSYLSLKLIGGTNSRFMRYTTDEAQQLLENASEDIEPTFFNGNESYNALIYGAEFNWIF